ncbi:hypothetical protein OG21DRAFT_1517795 [Imleria badia]|nr:hypothetical protein OG21DRAFT_1517795 [Imleria badia]
MLSLVRGHLTRTAVSYHVREPSLAFRLFKLLVVLFLLVPFLVYLRRLERPAEEVEPESFALLIGKNASCYKP